MNTRKPSLSPRKPPTPTTYQTSPFSMEGYVLPASEFIANLYSFRHKMRRGMLPEEVELRETVDALLKILTQGSYNA